MFVRWITPLNISHLTTYPTEKHGNPTVGLALFYCTHQGNPFILHIKIIAIIFFHIKHAKNKLWPHTDISGKVESWCKFISHIRRKRYNQDTKNSLTAQDWPQGRHRVWEASYCIVVEGLNSKTMGVKPLVVMGGSQKSEPWDRGRKWGRCNENKKWLNLPSAKGSRRSGEMIICLRRALYSSSRSAIFCGRCSANGSYCKTKMG